MLTPWLKGEEGHAWGRSQANHCNVVTLPWVHAALDNGYSPDTPPFMSADVAYVTLRYACRLFFCGTGCGTWVPGGGGGGYRYIRGEWRGKPRSREPLSPIPEPMGAGDLIQAKVFTGPRGALMRGSDWELCLIHWEEKRWVHMKRSGPKWECIPQRESIYGRVYDPRKEALCEGGVEGLSIT